MPETTKTETSPPAAPQPTAPPVPAPPPSDEEPLGEGGKKALEAERQARKAAEKVQKDLEAQLRAIQEKDQTELERAQSRLAELEKNYATAEAQRLRLQVATAHGITSEDLVLMTGTTEEELTAQATRIAALNSNRAAATAPPAFATSPGQLAGNGTPPAPATTVSAGRELYRSKHKPTA